MADLLNSKRASLVSAFESEELPSILDRIEDHLAFKQVAYEPASENTRLTTTLPSLDDLISISNGLKMSRAPLHNTSGVGRLSRYFLHFLNLVGRVFGSAQANFNRQLREFIGKLMDTLNTYHAQAAGIIIIISDLEAKVHALETTNQSYREEIDQLNDQMAALKADLHKTAKPIDDQLF